MSRTIAPISLVPPPRVFSALAEVRTAPTTSTPQPSPSAAAAPNPRLSLDQATGLVVIEFRSGRGGEPELTADAARTHRL